MRVKIRTSSCHFSTPIFCSISFSSGLERSHCKRRGSGLVNSFSDETLLYAAVPGFFSHFLRKTCKSFTNSSKLRQATSSGLETFCGSFFFMLLPQQGYDLYNKGLGRFCPRSP